ncbi:hypothetical protein BXZ70DRAFT_1006113 [Cristinia sonorae]|uniref:Uncharacterized protein n=1 Tax=Cristinia sonorae TaxID=1940300 RepID=A0A8K0URV9_9AGAR|nr:hypothetical protein BXZ70DRAFT_1006113 [Cristinia sonorae]
MALNDKNTTLYGSRGTDVYPGVANPTAASQNSDPLAANFVTDPTSDEAGAGAGPGFAGGRDAQRNFKETAGVVEGRPGIIETTHIDPLNENANDDWAKSRNSAGTGVGVASAASGAVNSAASVAYSAAGVAAGAAKLAYGTAVGDEASKKAGREAVWGKDA